MTDLEKTLREAGIDTSSFKVLFGEGKEAIYTLSTHGSAAIALWQVLRKLVEETGYWPVVLGSKNDMETHLTFLEQYGDLSIVPEVIEDGLRIDAKGWLDANLAFILEENEKHGIERHGDWPEEGSVDTIEDYEIPLDVVLIGDSYGYTPYSEVFVALVPTKISWHVPAWLIFGNWNDCPGPTEHVSILRRWEEQYGAEIVGISHDVIEMQVSRPPRDRTTAVTLAEEQYAFCYDIIDQGAETIEVLAAVLLNGRIWHFWWD